MARNHLLITAAIAATALASPAPAATPSSGEVSTAKPLFEWTGEAAGWGADPTWEVGETNGTAPECVPVVCDSLTVEVLDQADLTITADNTTASGPASDVVDLAVEAPDGSVTYVHSEDTKPVLARFRNAAKGTYTLYLETSEMAQNDTSYTGRAMLTPPIQAVAEPVEAAPSQPQAQPQSAPPSSSPQITIRTRSASVRRAAKRLRIAVASSAALTGVTARLLKGRRAVARGALSKLDGAGTIALKGKRLRTGRYTLVVTGTAGDGRKATSSVPFTLKR